MKKLVVFMLCMWMLATVSAASVIQATFDVDGNASYSSPLVYSGDIVFQVNTPQEVLCRYSTVNVDYNVMNQFKYNFNTIHQIELTNLHTGVHEYYVRCKDKDDINNPNLGKTVLEATFKISNPIAADIALDDEYLTAGKHEVRVETSKIASDIPKLSFSYDGISYSPVVLQGTGTTFTGYLVITETPREEVGSFRFEGMDLEGRIGREIIGDNVFLVDTKAPPAITVLDGLSEYGSVRLEWFVPEDEEIDKINIYRSENPNVNPTDLFRSVDGDEEYYIDEAVDDGETYYYRIAPEDSAGNVAALSREVRVTTLLTDSEVQVGGLDASLFATVDALLSEVALLEADLQSSLSMVNSKSSEEQTDLGVLGIASIIKSSQSELVIVRREIEKTKTVDYSESALESKLSTFRARMVSIQKKTPQLVSVVEQQQANPSPTEEAMQTTLAELSSEFSSSDIDKIIKQTQKLIEEKGFKVTSVLKVFEITYLDGSKEEKTVVKHLLDTSIEKSDDVSFLLRFPSGSLDPDALVVKNTEYTPEKRGLLSFEADTREVVYLAHDSLDVGLVNVITLTPLMVVDSPPPITGYFLSDVSSSKSFGAAVLVLVAVGLLGYLLYMKRSQKIISGSSDAVNRFINKAKEVKDLQKKGLVEEANQLYASLQSDYISLSDEEKHKVFKKVKHMMVKT